MPGWPPLSELSVRGDVVCGRTSAGEVHCIEQLTDQTTPAPMLGKGGDRYTSLAAGGWSGGSAACGTLENGSARCESTEGIAEVFGEHRWRQLATDGGMTCGAAMDGALYCWGVGELGDGRTQTSRVPVRVAGDLRL
jgi:hypothetical protein